MNARDKLGRGQETPDALFGDRIALLYEALPLAFSAIIIIGAVLAFVQAPVVGQDRAMVWYGCIAAVTGLRIALYRVYRNSGESSANTRWLNLFLLGVLLSGAMWGSSVYFLFPADNPYHQLFVVFVLGGMSAGAITTLAASFTALMLFLIPTMVPLIVRLVLLESSLNLTMAAMVTLYLIMISVSAKRSNRLVVMSLQRRYERERAEATIEFQACHDSLTELPNRRLLVERLNQEIARCQRHDTLAAALFVDIDRFKMINDSLGHAVGDALLREVAVRLRENVREEDIAARLGGDEFVVVLSDLGGDETLAARKAQRLAEKIGALLSLPYAIDTRVLHMTPSIGIALFPFDGADANEIIKQSDIAMYRAKELGRNMVQFFLPDMQAAAQKRMVLETELREALQRDEMELYFQPQTDTEGHTVGAEALLRWNHPQRGMVSPAEFIPVAEETGVILALGEWVLERACNQLKDWMQHSADGKPGTISTIAVNVSPRQFRQPDFYQRVAYVIESSGINPRCIELELTEGMLIENIEDTAGKMQRLSELGVRLAIDDFGTGYSSLLYLKRLQVDRIKIDQSFVRDVNVDANSATIVQTIILMAHNLGLDVIAEGVETAMELEFLQANGCGLYQGFYFSKPLPRDAFFDYLRR